LILSFTFYEGIWLQSDGSSAVRLTPYINSPIFSD
jgi:hypothetical protein